MPDPLVGARHQPGLRQMVGMDVVVVAATPKAMSISATCAAKAEQHSERCRADDHLSLDPRRVRGTDPRDLRHRAQARRTGLSRRRQHECAGRPRRGPASSAPTSAISTCTRPSAFRMAAAVPAWARSASRRISRRSCRVIRNSMAARRQSVRCQAAPYGSASILPISYLHPDDGRRRPDPRDRSRDPQRQLHREVASIRISRCSTRTTTVASRTSASSIRAH
jgi:hypothetical protein